MNNPVVRVVQVIGDENDINSSFLDCLHKSGLIIKHEVDPRGLTSKCFDVLPPDELSSPDLWCACLSDSLRNSGFNAVVAPSTK